MKKYVPLYKCLSCVYNNKNYNDSVSSDDFFVFCTYEGGHKEIVVDNCMYSVKCDNINIANDVIDVEFKKIDENAIIPMYKHYLEDSGFDLYTIEDVSLPPHSKKLIRTGLSVVIPNGYEIQIRPRSGLSLKTGLRIVNSPGTIDAGYRGEIQIIAQNDSNDDLFFEKNTRIAQGVLCRVAVANFVLKDDLESSERDTQGFGSSGVK